MRLFKPKKPLLIAAVVGVTVTALSGAFISGNLGKLSPLKQDLVGVKLYDFTPGTKVDYKILAGSEVISKDNNIIQEDGTLSLPIDRDSLNGSDIKYELSMDFPDQQSEAEPADILRVILDLDTKSGDIDFSAKGLDGFSDIQLSRGDKVEKLGADWAGLFSTKISGFDKDKLEGRGPVQFAFQNFGINGDISKAVSPKIYVDDDDGITGSALGDNEGSSLEAIQERWSAALITMTLQLSAVMEMQTYLIGHLFDANIQIDAQRKIHELQARAHKDYHPSEQMCRVGTFVRSLADSEVKSDLEKNLLNKYLIEQYTGVENTQAGGGVEFHESTKLYNYVEDYCWISDNDGAVGSICAAVTSMDKFDRINKDIDYTRTLMSKLTLDVNFADAVTTPEEEDVIALSKNLYFPSTFDVSTLQKLKKDIRPHYRSRSYAAKMGVAHNSFINIVGMKASAPEGHLTVTTTTTPPPPSFATGPPSAIAKVTTRDAPAILEEDSGWAYMKAMLREFDIPDEEIHVLLGDRPSYYAQMEVLTKKIYQSPNFYTNLYDKPTNVKRIGAALDAISLMHGRDRYESLLRREMLSAVLLEESLQRGIEEVNSGIFQEIRKFKYSN